MTTQEKLVSRKLTLIELAEFLKNVSQACKIHGVSRQHFYDINYPINKLFYIYVDCLTDVFKGIQQV